MNSKDFQIDDIEDTLKELQKERDYLTDQLADRKNKRLRLEKIHEAVHKKQMQLSEIHRKLSGTLEIGHHKVSQTQSQSETLEKHVEEKQNDIKAIVKKYEEEKALQLNHVNFIGKQLFEISKKMQEAKSFYTENNILKEIELIENKKKEMENQIVAIKADVEAVKMEEKVLLENLQFSKSDSANDFTKSLKDEVWEIFQKENEEYDNLYNKLTKELDHLTVEEEDNYKDNNSHDNNNKESSDL